MKKANLQTIIKHGYRPISIDNYSKVLLLPNGQYLKILNLNFYNILREKLNMDIEAKILASEQYKIDPRIKKPLIAVYETINGKDVFCAYVTEAAKGISLTERWERATDSELIDLERYAKRHHNLEEIIRNSQDIVLPDLLSCDNIFVDKEENIELIDFDGMQLGDHPTHAISTILENNQPEHLRWAKYKGNSIDLYGKQLDIKSLIYLYFIDCFHIDLSKTGIINHITNDRITLDDVFQSLNIINEPKLNDFMHKVWKVMQEQEENEYLEDDIFYIAENYELQFLRDKNDPKAIYKHLIRKK